MMVFFGIMDSSITMSKLFEKYCKNTLKFKEFSVLSLNQVLLNALQRVLALDILIISLLLTQELISLEMNNKLVFLTENSKQLTMCS